MLLYSRTSFFIHSKFNDLLLFNEIYPHNIYYLLSFEEVHFDRCGVISHFVLICISLISDVEYLFICLLTICKPSLKNVYSYLLPIFWLCCLFFFWYWVVRTLYILNIYPLSNISFTNIFSHSARCLFVLSMFSFDVQKLLSLIRSHLFIFAFVSLAWAHTSKKNIAKTFVKEYTA